MAIGAQRTDVIRMVLAEGARLSAAGAAIGIAASFWTARALSSFIYGVTVADPVTYAVASSALLVVALIASLVPAWRAARIDPMSALRTE